MNYSRQRAEVLDQIRGHKDHPTADTIFAELRTKDPSISLATVYRNLKLLSDLGEIRRLSFVSGADRFDPTVKAHYHFICEKCGKVYDVPMKAAEVLDTDVLDSEVEMYIPGVITSHDLVFHGICDECGAVEGSALGAKE